VVSHSFPFRASRRLKFSHNSILPCTVFPSTLVSMLELSPPLPILLLPRVGGLSALSTRAILSSLQHCFAKEPEYLQIKVPWTVVLIFHILKWLHLYFVGNIECINSNICLNDGHIGNIHKSYTCNLSYQLSCYNCSLCQNAKLIEVLLWQ
jgi:hypothetical protein